ncbi:MAG: FxsA family protein [Acidimicrobiales bacterium]
MFRFLVIAFIIVPIIEIYLIVQVDAAIGGWETLGLLVLDSVIGAWLVRREGFSILARVQGALGRGDLPTNELIDGMLVLFAGALMLTPGFLTDGLGFVLLLPPTRAVVRNVLKARFAGRISVGGGAYGAPFGAGFGGSGFTDVRWADVTRDDGDNRDDDDDGPPGAIELGPTSE